MKDYRNNTLDREPKATGLMRRGDRPGRIDRRFARRLFSLLLVISLLSNTLGFVADDVMPVQGRRASAEILELDDGIGAMEPNEISDSLTLDDSLGDLSDDGLDHIDDLSLSQGLVSNGQGSENTYVYHMQAETRLLLSDLVKKLNLPVRDMQFVENVIVMPNEQDPTLDMSLFVQIVALEKDFLFCLKPLFKDVRLTVYTVDGTFILRLVNDMTLKPEDVTLAAQTLAENPIPFDAVFSYDFAGKPARIRLSWLLEQVGLPIKLRSITEVGVVEHVGLEGQVLTIERAKNDYVLTVRHPFNEIELAVFTGTASYSIALLNGGAKEGGDDSEMPADMPTDIGASGVSVSGDPDLPDDGAQDLSGLELLDMPELDQGVLIDSEPEIEQVEEPVTEPEIEQAEEPVAEPEIEQAEEPAAEPETEQAEEPVAEPEIEQTEEPVAEPEIEQAEEPVAEPEIEQAEEPVTEPEIEQAEEPVTEPEIEQAEEPVTEPEIEQAEEPVAEPEIEQAEEPVTEPEIEQAEEPVAEPEIEQAEEPVAEPEIEQTEEPVVEPEIDQAEEPVAEPEIEQTEEAVAEPEIEQTEVPVTEPEMEQTEAPVTEPEIEQAEVPVTEPEIEQAEEPVAEPEIEQAEVPVTEPEIEQAEEPVAEPEIEQAEAPVAEPEVEQAEEPEAEREAGQAWESEAEPENEQVEEPEAEPEPTADTMAEDAVSAPGDAPEKAPVVETEDVTSDEPTVAVDDLSAEEAPVDEPQAEMDEAPAVAWPAATFTARTSGVNVSVTADEGAFPEGTTMAVRRVWDADTLSDIRQSVADDFVKVRRVQLVDITFYDAAGNEIEPRIPVSVVISVSEIEEDQNAVVVHMDDVGQTEVVEQTDAENGDGRTSLSVEMPAGDTEPAGVGNNQTEVSFEADSFSLYAVVVTETISTHYIDASGNTYSVEVSYGPEAGIPSGAKLAVSELTGAAVDEYAVRAAEALDTDADNLNYIKALDIAIKKDGEPVQPKAPVNVSIRLKDAPETMEKDNINVVHFGDEPEVLDCALDGDTVGFESDGFSVYVIAGSDAIARCTYTFWVPSEGHYSEYPARGSDGSPVYSQTVKSIDELVVPQLVSTDTKEFAGWYAGKIVDGNVILEDNAYSFDTATIPQGEDSAVYLYAVFKEYAYVYFHGQYDSSFRTFPVSSTVREELVTTTEGETTSKTAEVDIGDVTASYSSTDDTNMDFYGWSYTPVQTPGVTEDSNGNSYVIQEDPITISGETHLYPIYKEIHWLTYYAAQSGLSAAYVAPASFYAGDPVEYDGSFSLPTTARDGYTFLGWWTGTLNSTKVGNDTVETVDYGTQITDAHGILVNNADVESSVYISQGKLYLRRNVTLYAKWQATYNIVYWKQKTTEDPSAADKTYEYAQTVSRTADIGNMVAVEENDRAEDRYAGYTFGHCDPPAVIGNTKALTVLNVYYDLSGAYSPAESGSYTLTFADSVTGSGASEMPAAVTGLSYRASLAGSAPVDPISSRTSESGRAIYSFDRWYADKAATIPVFFTAPTTEETESLDKYVVVDTMPDHDVTVYAGWTPIKFRVDIDPNYGALYYYDDEGVLQGTGATYFNSTYDAEPIGEYTHVTRDYEESTSGAYFYVNHDRAYGGSDRFTYYTTKQSEATEDTTFEYSPGTYTYAGWYEVYSDGSEASEPYDFSQHTDHATTLRLHWKKSGAYYLKYNAVVDDLTGTMDDADASAELFADGDYADYAEITLTHSAVAPTGYTFIGWKVRGSDSTTIYTPGQSFTLHADDAIRTSGKEVVFLDAVYTRVDSASITYDANGGTVSGSPDYGSYPSRTGGKPEAASGTVDTNAGTATVSGLENNSEFILSSGTGFGYTAEGVTYTLAGWSNQADYDPDDPDAELYTVGGTYGVDSEEPTTLYAVWQTKVTYHLNNTTATWGGTGAEGAWESPYTSEVVSSETVYTLNAYLGNVVDEPPYIPKYTGTDNVLFKYWATKGTDGGTETYMQYDFTQAVTGAPDLYAYWSKPNTVTVHVVDASTATLSEVASGTGGWTIDPITVGMTSIALPGSGIVTAPSDYEIAFVAAHDSAEGVAAITEAEAVNAVVYDSAKKGIYVTYADGTSAALPDGAELYYVCYQKKALNIDYKSMAASGELSAVETTGAAYTTGALGTYDMQSQITGPLSLASGFSSYAFAIGSASAADASALSIMTDSSDSNDTLPALKLRNTWQGFQYSEDGSTWVSCGYDPTLYVIYFTQQPTTIILKEKTVGSSSIMDTGFIYNVTVTQTVANGSETTTTTLFDTTPESEGQSYHKDPYILINGEEQSAILFFSSAEDSTTTQTITITQTTDNHFDTEVSSEAGTETQPNEWTYTSDGSGGSQTVTFTNTHKALPVEVHVAMVSSNGLTIQDNLRSTKESNYSFALALGAQAVTLTTQLPSDGLYDQEKLDLEDYAFGAVVYGTSERTDGSPITLQGMGAVSIAYAQIEDNVYELVLKDSSGRTIGELGSNNLYYLYYPMPKIRYMKADADGNLTKITGSIVDSQTGSVVASDSITYDHEAVVINGQTVAYDQSIEIPLSGLTISQSGNNFRMPAVLDDGLLERYLGYTKLGAGSTDITTVGALADSTEDLTMYLRISDNALQFSIDNSTWQDLPMSVTPTIYAIYEERGYDLQISKTVDMSNSGTDSLFADKTFTVTISSTAITKSSYSVTGSDTDTITATPASGTTPGTIVLNDVMDGTRIRIKGLGPGDYTITETENDNYILSAKTGAITGTTTSTATVTDNSSLEISLTEGTKVDLTNTPKAICKIGDVKFYTLRSAIAYIETQGSTTSIVEMLTDYLMPSVDTVTIPSGYAVTFTTAEEGFEGAGTQAVITRSEDLADSILFTNQGTLAFTNMVLEGNSISSRKPMIQSAGDLTIGASAVVRNAINTGSGGVVSATAGNITVSSGTITRCSAANGGAIYNSGNGEITVSGTGKLQNNTATTGDGGAIYTAAGTITISGSAQISGNKAESGNGGAIFAGSAVIDISQSGSLTWNTAKKGGAIYAETGTITVSNTATTSSEVLKPSVSNNTASDGDGGAIWVGSGSITASGGTWTGNKAESGKGGAIYANGASVTVSEGTFGGSTDEANIAREGGAIYVNTGTVTVSGGTIEYNTASAGNGGAVYAGSGNVTVSGGSIANNSATASSGGAVYAGTGNVILSDEADLSDNTAKTNGGAVYAGGGSVTVSCESLNGNTATDGKGGAVYAESGAVAFTGVAVSGNTAGSDGGAMYAGSGTMSVTGGSMTDNTSEAGNGGALCAGSGSIALDGVRFGGVDAGNEATSGSGGAVYAGSGIVSLTNTVTMTYNTAGTNGGALYVGSGSASLASTTSMANNSAVNGAAVFVDSGRATFTGGTYTTNTASEGGAVGMGSTDARLYFSGDVNISGNTLSDDTTKSNIYLDQDSKDVLIMEGLGGSASLGIYVPDSMTSKRDVPGARFATYTNDSNVTTKISNDRRGFSVQKDEDAKQLFWGAKIKVEVRYQKSFAENIPPASIEGTGDTDYQVKKAAFDYFPEFDSAAISELADEIKNTYSLGLSSTAVYAIGFAGDAAQYSDYVTNLDWDDASETWELKKRDGNTEALNGRTILIYYAEPAYISIENNASSALEISSLTVGNTTVGQLGVINTTTNAGYGAVYAKNGSVRSALLPVTEDDLNLGVNAAITILLPGGQGMTYHLDGAFGSSVSGTVRLRRGSSSPLPEETLTVTSGSFAPLTGSTPGSSATYKIIFGNDRYVCKVVDSAGGEHRYTTISGAINDVKNGTISLTTAKTATIQMLVDYLLPSSDAVVVPAGYDITFTTATEGTYTYKPVDADEPRATISRDTDNTNAMISTTSGSAATALTIKDLVFNVKGVQGSTEYGAVVAKGSSVTVDNVDFTDLYANNGGAIFAETTSGATNSWVKVKDSYFYNCHSIRGGSRDGGGAIHAYVDKLKVEGCEFDSCEGNWQAGAVFHRVEFTNNYTESLITKCTFTNCRSKAAGGMELGSRNIIVKGCTFEHCYATSRNGGGFNVYIMTTATGGGAPTFDCWTRVEDCTFNDCGLTAAGGSNDGNGGGFRSSSKYTTVVNTTFTNCTSLKNGGAVALSNGNAVKAELIGVTISGCSAVNGGAVHSVGKQLVISDSYDVDANGNPIFADGTAKAPGGANLSSGVKAGTHRVGDMKVENCTAATVGGIYHDKDDNSAKLTIANATITGNTSTTSTDVKSSGGGVQTKARTVSITGSNISNNTTKGVGGGLNAYKCTNLNISDTTISNNTAASNGGGVWLDADSDTNRNNQVLTIKGSAIDGNTSGGSGGGIYTLAKTVTIGASETRTDSSSGKPIRSSVSHNTAKTNGGGVYQSRNVDGSKLEISDVSIDGNGANGGAGGGVYAGVRTLTATSAEISRNTATSDGGGVYFYIKDNGDLMDLTVEGCTMDTNISGGNGGGVYTIAKTVEIKAHTEGTGEEAVTTNTTISDCTTAKNGGGIYQNRDAEGSVLTISDAVISGNTANGTGSELGGGGVYANVWNMTLTASEVSGNTAAKHGGGIYKNSANNDRYLKVDNSRVKNNTAGNQGGGIYCRSQLYLRNNSEVSDNHLTSSTVDNAAGVFLENNRTLYVGPEFTDATAAAAFTDSSSIKENHTAAGTDSNLRLWWASSQNAAASVYVYCHLNGNIGVTNAAKVGTQFGTSFIANPDGFQDDAAVFQADTSTLHGIIDRTDTAGVKIIWAGPPIAKITGKDADGNDILLYMKDNGTGPAIFDKLNAGNNSNYGTSSAFGILNTASPTLYTKDGELYEGKTYSIKMLVENYTSETYLIANYYEGRELIFTTAGAGDTDGYPFEGSTGGRATVTRGAGTGNNSFLNANCNLTLTNIVIDGGSQNGITAQSKTRNLYINNANAKVTLGEGAILQNATVKEGDGGGVYINTGSFEINGGVIRNCATITKGDGGGVYLNSGTFTLKAGTIYQCSANGGSGGGVRDKGGKFYMSGGTIRGCSAVNGGGVYLPGSASNCMYMSGGSIINNSATKVGGGIAFYDVNSRLYLSGKVNVSGNTATKDGQSVACNVELNHDRPTVKSGSTYNLNSIINTNNGGLKGGSYIGVYVPDDANCYDKHGKEKMPFGTFAIGDNTTNLYSFVNDRNGLKGGIIENPSPNTIYWIQIFSLTVSKEVLSSASNPADTDETFSFTVHIRGNATATGQLNAAQIDSSTGYYGGMTFESNGRDTTTATFTLKAGESMTAVNLSQGLDYEVIENLTDEQKTKYATLPATVYTGTIGENRGSTGKDPYTSVVKYINVLPVCKITKPNGNLLYVKYTDSENGAAKTFYVPAVYTELTGNGGAFKALESETFYQSDSGSTTYAVSGDAQIKMLIASYTQREAIELPGTVTGTVTLTTAGASDARFPKQDSGTAATIARGGFTNASMFTAGGKLVLTNIILDGAKGIYTSTANGGIVSVPSGGRLTVQTDAVLQNSTTSGNGGAVYVNNGGAMTLTGGKIWKNEVTSNGDGAGIYLAHESTSSHGTLYISGGPSFGRVMSQGSFSNEGNYKQEELTAKGNGGTYYPKPRQDIYIAGYQSDSDDDTSAASLVVNGEISSDNGSIWVWAAESPHYWSTRQFAKIEEGMSISVDTLVNSLKAFRNARDDKAAKNDTGSYLYGITKDGRNALWNGKPVCKLTDSNNVLLYERVSVGSRYVFSPAVYSTVAEGFNATTNALYYNSGRTPYPGALKLKMLQDYELDSGEANITYDTARDLTFTTAEIRSNNSDGYYYSPATGATGDSLTNATLTKAQSTASMFTVNTTSNSFTVKDLIFDGGTSVMTTENVNGGAFNITSVTSASFSGVTINKLNTTGDGGAIYLAKGTLNVTDSTIEGCSAVNGGGICADGNATTVNLLGTTAIEGNTATVNGTDVSTGNGGGVHVKNSATLNIGGSTRISNNIAQGHGGGVYTILGDNKLTLSDDATISGNEARHKEGGGGIYLCDATLDMTGGTISNNVAGTVTRDEDGSITDTTITTGGGGGVRLANQGVTFTMSGGTISGNSAANGGAVYVDTGASLIMSGGKVGSSDSANTATNGAGVYLKGSGVLTGGTISHNSATGKGGGAYVASGSSITMSETAAITDNSVGSVENGGGVYIAGEKTTDGNGNESAVSGIIHVQGGVKITGNTAGSSASNLRISGDTSLVVDGNLTANAAIGICTEKEEDIDQIGVETAVRENLDVITYDRNASIYAIPFGTKKVVWKFEPVCKLTDDSDKLLFKNEDLEPAVYMTLADGFEAAAGALYNKNGGAYSDSSTVKLKMLMDYTVPEQVNNRSNRPIIFTTAENNKNASTLDKDAGDIFIYSGMNASKATVTRGFDNVGSMVQSYGILTVQNLKLNGGNQYNPSKERDAAEGQTESHQYGGILNIQSGTLNISADAELVNGKARAGGAIYAADSSIVNISAGSITGNSATNGGAVYMASGMLNVNGSASITNNEVTGTNSHGGAIFLSGTAQAKISAGTISGNKAVASGGAVYAESQSAVSVSGGEITNNQATGNTSHGGAIAASGTGESNHAQVNVSGGTITGNTAVIGGGAVYLESYATFELSGTATLSNNKTTGTQSYGGAIFATANSTVTVSGGTIRGSTTLTEPCARYGGAIYLESYSRLNMSSGQIMGCNAGSDGGAMYVTDYATVEMTGGSILNCTASNYGGAIYNASTTVPNNGSTISLTNATIDGHNELSSETANARSGGGICMAVGTLALGESSRIEDCTASLYGGAIYNQSETVPNNGSTVSRTNATIDGHNSLSAGTLNANSGGGIYMQKGTLSVGSDSRIEDCTASIYGGAIYNQSENVPNNGSTVSLTNATIDGHNDLLAGTSNANSGGGVYMEKGTLSVGSDSRIEDCTASLYGGAVYDSSAGKAAEGTNPAICGFTMTGGTITGNTASNYGGAVYVAANATAEMTGGEIVGNTANTNGAGIYLAENSKLKLKDNPSFGGTDVNAESAILGASGNFVEKKGAAPWVYSTTDANKPKNGDKAYPVDTTAQAYKVRQDIFVAGYSAEGSAANSLVVTGAINSEGPGSIWVWAEAGEHYRASRQFAVFESAEVKSGLSTTELLSTMETFRNAQADKSTDCSGEFLRGQEGDDINGLKCIYWSSSGFNVVFRKIDGNGNPLPGAAFTLYEVNAAGTGPDTTKAVGDPVASDSIAAETPATFNVKVTDNSKTPPEDKPDPRKVYGEGLVVFEKVPHGTYFLVETTFPTGVKNDAEVQYKLVVDPKGWFNIYAASEDTNGNTVYTTEAPTTSFVKEATGDKYSLPTGAVKPTDTTLPVYTILNESPLSRKVILRKVDEDNYASLSGAHFHILRADLSEYTEGQPTGKTWYESGASAAFYIGKLPFGTYYLVETVAPTAPAGYNENTGTGRNIGKVFKLTVDKDTSTSPGISVDNTNLVHQLTSTGTEDVMIAAFRRFMNTGSETVPAGGGEPPAGTGD